MKSKKRNPVAAALLSFIVPGLGQTYNGQLLKGIIFFLLSMVLPFLIASTGLQLNLYGLIALLALGICYWLFVIGDALCVAIKKREVVLKLYNRWYVYLLVAVLVIPLGLVTSSFIMNQVWRMKPYQIATGSMEPTLLIGDHVLVNLMYYRNKELQRGDLVMIEYPQDPSKLFIKRVIGLGGEKIEIKDKQVYINDEPIQEDYKIHNDSQIFRKDEASLGDYIRDNFGPANVPSGCCFVLGDNRDNSMDSRYWEFSTLSSVRGKPWVVYFSYEVEPGAYLKQGLAERLKRLASMAPKARCKRIFHLVE